VVLAFALPWGAFAVCGRPVLTWLVEGNPAGPALLAAILRFMGLLAVFFVFDFAINFLSALLRAMKEEVYLLTATAVAAGGFGLFHLVRPPPDGTWLMGAFIAAQAAWAGLLLVGVVGRWPMPAAKPRSERKQGKVSVYPSPLPRSDMRRSNKRWTPYSQALVCSPRR
jgi:hypothetical protein